MNIREKLRKPRSMFWIVIASAGLINLGSFLWMYFAIPREAYPFIIHYNIYFGQDILGSKWMLFQIPLTGLGILILNAVLALTLWEKARYVSWVVAGVTVFLQLFVLYGSLIIISVNT